MNYHSRFLASLLLCVFALSAFSQVHVQVSLRDLRQRVITRRAVLLTPVAPYPRTQGTNLFTREPLALTTDAAGLCTFSNMMWGTYRLDVFGTPFASFNLSIGTNLSGVVSAAALVTNPQALPPNPATNYYTMAQVDALLALLGGGGGVPLRGEAGVNVTTVTGTNVASLADTISVKGATTRRLDLSRWIASLVVVQDAGTEAVNGYYFRDETAEVYTYVKAGTADYKVRLGGNVWTLETADGLSTLYTKGVGDSPVNGTWNDVIGGVAPAPTVSFDQYSWPMDFQFGGGVYWLSNAQPPFVGYTVPTLYWRTYNESFQVVDTPQ